MATVGRQVMSQHHHTSTAGLLVVNSVLAKGLIYQSEHVMSVDSRRFAAILRICSYPRWC